MEYVPAGQTGSLDTIVWFANSSFVGVTVPNEW